MIVSIGELGTNVDDNDINDSIGLAISLRSVLQLVLLPTGLNLRNLVWHGFVGNKLPRPWFALVIILIHQVTQLQRKMQSAPPNLQHNLKQPTFARDDNNSGNALRIKNQTLSCSNIIDETGNVGPQFSVLNMKRYHPALSGVVDRGTGIREALVHHLTSSSRSFDEKRYVDQNEVTADTTIQNNETNGVDSRSTIFHLIRRTIIPESHSLLWDFCIQELLFESSIDPSLCSYSNDVGVVTHVVTQRRCRSIAVSIVLTILLEQVLRILYCQINTNRVLDVKASFDSYYITLDGHGQRHQHDLLLLPYQLHGCVMKMIDNEK